ncbi:hypothetical protein [Pedobacter yulinensis]|nr:hypothetical protein [Pedobacter yulinensis]
MKKLILTAVIAVFAFTASYAQDSTRTRLHKAKGTAEQRAKNATAMLTEKLALTAEQQKKVYDIELERVKTFEGMRRQTGQSATMEARKAAMKASRDKMNSVLSQEQQTKFDSLRTAQRRQIRPKSESDKARKKHKGVETVTPPAPR